MLNAVREHSQYQAQLVDVRSSIIAAYYKLQVEFGMMSWQQFDQNRQEKSLFSPLDPVQNWLIRQDSTRQPSDTVIIQPVIRQTSELITYPMDDAISDSVYVSQINDVDESPLKVQ